MAEHTGAVTRESHTLSDLEAAGALDVMRPADVACSVAASVMRHLLAHHEHRQIGSAGMPQIVRDAIEREFVTALRSVARRKSAHG